MRVAATVEQKENIFKWGFPIRQRAGDTIREIAALKGPFSGMGRDARTVVHSPYFTGHLNDEGWDFADIQ